MAKSNQVYQHSADYAYLRGELALYRDSHIRNIRCTNAIDKAIQDNLAEDSIYKMKPAVISVIKKHGVERMNWVLANTVQNTNDEGAFLQNSIDWAAAFAIPKGKDNQDFSVKTLPSILEGFIINAREICAELQQEKKPSILGQVKENATSIQTAEKKNTQKKQPGLEV